MTGEEQTNPDFLTEEQYDSATQLNTRIHIQQRYRSNPQNWFLWTFERFKLPARAHVLELGCGPGDLWLDNLERLPDSWQIVLSDLSPGMAFEARHTDLGSRNHFSFAVLDVQAIPFQAGTFEAVIAFGLLDHVADRVRALDEIRRVLKPGGRFYAATGGRTHLQEIEELVRPFIPEADYGGDPQRFGLENGQKLLSPWFSNIRRYDYDDELVFEHARPIIEYVLSEASIRDEFNGERRKAFEHFVEQELAARGKILVKVDKGLFEGVKESDPQ